MITKIDLGNFKSFKQLKEFRLAPITILSGKNSSGKSSILHSLLLLKQSLSGEPDDQALKLDGKYLQFSSLRELSFGLPLENSAKISYGFELEGNTGPAGYLYFEIRTRSLSEHTERKGTVVTFISWRDKDHCKSGSAKRWKEEFKLSSKAGIEYPLAPKNWILHSRPTIRFERFLPIYIMCDATKIDNKVEDNEHVYLRFPLHLSDSPLSDLSKLLRTELRKMKYLGPSRAIPRRAYIHYSEGHFELDPDGGNAAYVFWLRKDEDVQWLGKKIQLKKAIYECFSILGFKQHVSTRRWSNFVYQILVGIPNFPNRRVTIADVGFGYSQVLPIILCVLLSNENALILLEQPEIHLHPSAKAKLADLLIAFYRSGKRLLVETHSSELINGLQLQAIQNPDLIDKINVTFVVPPSENDFEGSQIRQLTLKEDGMFDQWPEGFCDESEQLATKILRAGIDKMGEQ